MNQHTLPGFIPPSLCRKRGRYDIENPGMLLRETLRGTRLVVVFLILAVLHAVLLAGFRVIFLLVLGVLILVHILIVVSGHCASPP
jgi:hypothetical protein